MQSLIDVKIVENCDGKFLCLSNDGIGNHLLRGDRWEAHFTQLVSALLSQGDIAVDVGANMGCNTVALARAVAPDGIVYAFEPLRIPFQLLCGNCMLNSLPHVITKNIAIGDGSISEVQMNPVQYTSTWINIGDTQVGKGGEQVAVRSLDSFDLPKVDFIKIDVQGYEPRVLRGATATIDRCRPLLFVEIEEPQLKSHGSSTADLINQILGLGYRLLWIKNNYPVDFLCVPKERQSQLSQAAGLLSCPYEIIG